MICLICLNQEFSSTKILTGTIIHNQIGFFIGTYDKLMHKYSHLFISVEILLMEQVSTGTLSLITSFTRHICMALLSFILGTIHKRRRFMAWRKRVKKRWHNGKNNLLKKTTRWGRGGGSKSIILRRRCLWTTP